jgi:probable HAF family extracellular repeat protein
MSLSHCLRFFCGLMALGLLLGLAEDVKAQPTYVFTTLDVPGSSLGLPITVANGINASGQIVGWYVDYVDPLYHAHGFLFDQGSYTTLDMPGSTWTEVHGINDAGQIVGYYQDAADNGHGFLYDQGSYTTIDLPSQPRTSASGINVSGQIVGWYTDQSGGHGFLFENGSYTTLDVPGSIQTLPYGINASGQIVGDSSLGPFLLDQGSYTIGLTSASGINDAGQIVGAYDGHGFLYDQGGYTTFDVPGAYVTFANGINASGQIVGRYSVSDVGPVYGFLATPVP